MRQRTLISVFILMAAGCAGEEHTELRPNASGKLLAIGAPCKPEDGWQYMYPPGWPQTPTMGDGGVIIPQPVPPDYKEPWQLEPGIGYCVIDPRTAPDGFFTSNCHADRDCPKGSRCDDANRCNLPCGSDSDCRPGNYCPSRPSGARFCEQGCPVEQPAPHYGCYVYTGPRACYYPAESTAAARTLCRCVHKPQNDAQWECAPEDSCPPSPVAESPCRLPSSGELTCRYEQYGAVVTCACQSGTFSCMSSESIGNGGLFDASATPEAGTD
jgi:hypothetical protein